MAGINDLLASIGDGDDDPPHDKIPRVETSGLEVVALGRQVITQAEKGSITAILQLLNESLAAGGVRTRAVLEGHILHVLCEAPTPEGLDQAVVIPHVRHLLETISPPNVQILQLYGRLLHEQQSLWLQEIRQGSDQRLLWSERLSLKQPNPWQRVVKIWITARNQQRFVDLQQDWPSPDRYKKRHPWLKRGIIALAVVVTGAAVAYGVGQWRTSRAIAPPANPPALPIPTAAAIVPNPAPDFFVQAVRLAEQSAQQGKEAQNRADWLALAAQWQQASDLMALVPESDPRYVTAQDRVQVYQTYSEEALKHASEF